MLAFLSLCLAGFAFVPGAYAAGTALINASTVSGSPSVEEQIATSQGYTVTVVSDAVWGAMTAAQFGSYDLLIVGDPFCSTLPPGLVASASVFGPVVLGTAGGRTLAGNRVLVGTDPVLHGGTLASARGEIIRDGIAFAGKQPGRTGLYFDATCAANFGQSAEILTILAAISTGSGSWTINASPPCGGAVSLIASEPSFAGLTTASLEGWGCSVHESFPTFPTDWSALAVATDTPTHPVCGVDPNTGLSACGEAYILIAGSSIIVISGSISITPLDAINPVGTTHTVTAHVTSGGVPLAGQVVTFTVTGQNAGAVGTCVPAGCETDINGDVSFTYTGAGGAGDDTIKASFTDATGSLQSATAQKHWTDTPPPPCTPDITVKIYEGFTLIGGGTPYISLLGTFTASSVSFATDTGFNWHPFGAPSFGADITGFITACAGGDYQFCLNSDDGSLLFIDGSLVVDNGGPRAPSLNCATATLTAGTHTFEVQFFECCGGPSGVDLILPAGVNYGCECPCVLTCPANVTTCNDAGHCGAVVNYPAPTATTGCGAVTCSPPSSSTFPVGTTTVTCTAASGESCTFSVTVNDCEPPTVTCPDNITGVCNDPGQCSATTVHWIASASDACGLASFECNRSDALPLFDPYPVGTITVTCTATDTAGLGSSCSFTVTVNDCEAPVAECIPTTNPAGKNIPVAGKNPKSGQNPDGFYQLLASDNCPNPLIFVKDSAQGPCGGSFAAGPYRSGDKVKLTQSPGKRSVKPMAGVIVAHIQTKGDPVLVAIDGAGNESVCQSCLVPPPPK